MLNERYMEMASALEEQQRNIGRNFVAKEINSIGSEICNDCGCTIPELRRKVVPWATRCTLCQDAVERKKYKKI